VCCARTMMAMTVIGQPAKYAKQLRRKNAARAVVAAAGAVATLAVAPWLMGTIGMLGLAISVGAAGACAVLCQQARIAAAKNTAGINAEVSAGKALRHASFDMIAFGAMLGHGDCDVIVAGPQLAIVEVKHGRGRVRMEHGALRDDRKLFASDPLRQATAQAAALGRLTGCFVDAVVCVTQMTNPPFTHKNTVVCSVADLASVLQRLPRRVSQLQAAALAGELRAQAP